jgi:hypothetical protein
MIKKSKNLKAGSETGEENGDGDQFIDGKPEDAKGFGDLVFNGFGRDLQLLGDLLVGQQFEAAQVKDLAALFRQRGHGAVEHFLQLLRIEIFFRTVVERQLIDMVEVLPGNGPGPQVHKTRILYRLEKISSHVVNMLVRTFLPQGNKTILNDVLGGIAIFHHVERGMIQFLPMPVEEGGKSPLVSPGNAAEQVMVVWLFVVRQMHGSGIKRAR